MANASVFLLCALCDVSFSLERLLLFRDPNTGMVFCCAVTTNQVGLVGSSGLFLTQTFFENDNNPYYLRAENNPLEPTKPTFSAQHHQAGGAR